MNLLVTGGAGFIGTNFIQYILDEHSDYSVVCIDKLTYASNQNNIEDFKDDKRFEFIQADICNSEQIVELFRQYKFDMVVNFAAESHVDRSIDSTYSRNFINSNISGVFTFLEIFKKFKVKRFLQVSTDEVYGSLGNEGKFVETMNLNPSSLYSSTKASADLIVLSYYHTFDMPVLISRCSNNYGNYQHPEKFIPLTITNALDGKKIPIYGTGLNVRDWINVFDHCRALETILHYGKIGQVYNVGGGNEIANINIVKLILDYLDLPYKLMENVDDRLGHDWRYAMDYSKLNTELGWKPKIEFEEGLKDTIEWYKHNEEWWRPLK